jgi:uncharacterized protein YceK
MRSIILMILFILLNGCSEFAILMSGTSVAVSQNVYSRVYSGADILTIIGTDKSIKGHVYDKIKGE